eukprot:TRINITY_DN13993_c0_g2_i2.p1 TRINITY_DN13993_c0_g2~~TRINITY_DN13993_c0_g2_i2.p1  ORF type:complete len:462 (+),score=77.40 TRINITY_DN13993_c0_g2_i2:28-1386(+)
MVLEMQQEAEAPMLSVEWQQQQRHDAQFHEDKRLRQHLTASCFIMFAGGFRATQLFPYASMMTQSLRASELDLGFWTGLMLTAQPLGMLPTANLWAHFSNIHGRRICLQLGLISNVVTLLLISFSSSYWTVVLLRFISGALDSTLAIMRTSLREAYQAARRDDTWGFSLIQVAFGASSVAGPALGGILYGQQQQFISSTQLQPWLVPYMLCTVLYVLAAGSSSDSKLVEASLLQRLPFLLLLIMCGGHSYVFTGWELAFPFLARLPLAENGEQLDAGEIGTTFLIGSLGLMAYTSCLYPKMVKQFSVLLIWTWSCALTVPIVVAFPRIVKIVSAEDIYDISLFRLVNYLAQFSVSVLLGSGFTSIQLMINSYVSRLPNASHNLSLANGWLSSTQALVRAFSPSVTGALFAARYSSFSLLKMEGCALSFDSLAAVLAICCVACALFYAKLIRV